MVEPGGQLDMQQLLAAAAEMQTQFANAQEELASATIEGTAGGGLVKAVVSGEGELLDLVIAPEAIDTSDPADTAQTIADLVLAAIRDASEGAADLQDEMREKTIGPFAAGFGGGGIPGGFGGGDIMGMLGGGGGGDIMGMIGPMMRMANFGGGGGHRRHHRR